MENRRKIYIVGIEGSGTSALAQIYASMGYEVLGSDNGDHFYWRVLEGKNIKVFQNFDKKNIPDGIEFAIKSSAFNDDNVEIAELMRRRIQIYSYSEALGKLFNEKVGIAVSGTHGKTTTTAMLADVMAKLGVSPTALVGSEVVDWKTNVFLGKGEYFIAEADEYQNKLQYYNPWSVILTSVDWDHPDFFVNFSSYKDVFTEFVKKIPITGFLVVWGDSSDTLEVAENARCSIATYGFGEDNYYRIINHEQKSLEKGGMQTFEIICEDGNLGSFEISLVGKHNVLNAASVIALCLEMKLDIEKVRNALKEFNGTLRRFEKVGMFQDVVVIDDYAHHPDEIKATLGGAREYFPEKNIWTVFHPHTFTRTKALLQEFSQSFEDTDRVIVIDIYGSARELHGGISSKELVDLINKYLPGRADYIPTMDEAVRYLIETYGRYDVLITMGAGDVWKIAKKLTKQE